MSDFKYRILWLDDFFESTEDASSDKLEQEAINAFQDDVNTAIYYGIKVNGISNFESFCEEIKNLGSYQAVVFDLKGMAMDQTVDDNVMPKAYEMVKRKLPCYIYSANTRAEKFDLSIKDIQEAGRAFSKGLGVDLLYKKIREDLDANLHYYEGKFECLALFNKGYLAATNRNNMDELLKMYADNDIPYVSYNPMRIILEKMLDKLIEKGLIMITEEQNSRKAQMRYITQSYDKDPDGTYNPKVPLSVCSQDTKYILDYLWNMTNHFSHNSQPQDNLIKQSVYNAFFVAMKWFHDYMDKSSRLS